MAVNHAIHYFSSLSSFCWMNDGLCACEPEPPPPLTKGADGRIEGGFDGGDVSGRSFDPPTEFISPPAERERRPQVPCH